MPHPTNPSSRTQGVHYGARKLGEVCEIFNGVSVPKAEMKSAGKFKIIKNRDYNENEIFWHNDENGWTDREVSENKFLKIGDSLLINAAHNKSHVASKIGYVTMLKYPRVVTSGEVMVIRAKKGLILPEIIHFQLQNSIFINRLKELVDGIHLYPKDVVKIEIPLPPIVEQKKIVARLEGLLGKIKEAKCLRAEAQEAAQNLLPAELHRIFTQQHSNILQNVGMSSKQKWEEKELGEVVTIQSGFGFPKHLQGKNNGKYPFLKVSDMNLPRNKTEISEWNNMVGEEEKEKMGYKSAPAGTIIFPKIGGAIATNKKRILMQDSIYDNNVMGLIPSKNINSKFLFYWLTGFDLSNWAAGSSLPAITKSRVSETKILLPPVAEQKKIVARLDSLSEKIKNLREYQKSTASDFISLEKSVLHKAFSRELV